MKARRVYKFPLGGYRWDPPSQESALGWIWLAGLLHPERETGNLRAVMRDWFSFLYKHDLTDDEIDGVLFAAQNRQSAGYERYLTPMTQDVVQPQAFQPARTRAGRLAAGHALCGA